MKYVHVKLEAKSAFWLEVISETDQVVFGWLVDREGSREDVKHFIMKDAEAVVYIRPAQMNLTYCQLEEVR